MAVPEYFHKSEATRTVKPVFWNWYETTEEAVLGQVKASKTLSSSVPYYTWRRVTLWLPLVALGAACRYDWLNDTLDSTS